MKNFEFIYESTLPWPPSVVFAWHLRPEAFTDLMPPWEHARLVRADPLAQGVVWEVKTRVFLGLSFTMFVEIVVFDPPHCFVDEQKRGLFAYWRHEHQFLAAEPGQTRMRDWVRYRLPLGRLGAWCGRRIVAKRLQRMFVYRHEALRKHLEAGSAVEGL